MNEANWRIEIINMFRQFKLGNSLFSDVHVVTHRDMEVWKTCAIDHEKIMLEKIRQYFAEFILMHQETAIKKTDLEYGIEYRTELLVLKLDEFKLIIEAVICLLPDDKIQEIKNGKGL